MLVLVHQNFLSSLSNPQTYQQPPSLLGGGSSFTGGNTGGLTFNFPPTSNNNLQPFSASSFQLSQQPSSQVALVGGGLSLPNVALTGSNTQFSPSQVSISQKISDDFAKLTSKAGEVGSTIGAGLTPIMKTFTPTMGVTNTVTQPQTQLQPQTGNMPIFNQALQGITNVYGDMKKNLEFNPTGTTSLSQGYSGGTGKVTSQSTSKLEENLGIGKAPGKITVNERSSVIDNLNNLYKSSEEFKKDNPLFVVNPVLGSIAAMATPDKSDPTKMKWDVWNENVAKETTQKIIPNDAWVKANTGGPTANFTRGLVGYVRDRPLDVGVDVGTMIGMELLSGGTATAATPEIVAAGGVRPVAIKGIKAFVSKIIPYVEPGVMSLYGGSAAADIASKPTQEAKEMALGGWSGRFITGFGDNAVRAGLTRNVVDSVPNDMRVMYNNMDGYAKARGVDLSIIPEAGTEHNFLINLDDNKVISMIEGDAGSVPGQKIYNAVKEAYDNGYKNIASLHTHPGGSPTPSGSMAMDSKNIGQIKGLSGDLMSEVKQFSPDGIIKKYGIISTNPEGFGYNRRFVTYDVAPTQLDAQGRAIASDKNRDNLEMYIQKKQMVQDYDLLPQESKYFSSSDPLYKAKEIIYPIVQKLDSLPLQKARYALHDFAEPLLYKDAKQLRMFDKIPGVNAVRVNPSTPLDTEYTGVRDLKNLFGGNNKIVGLPKVESISGGLNQLDKKMDPIIQLNPLEKQTLTKLKNGELTSENIIGFDKNGNSIPIEFESGVDSVKVINKDSNIVGDSHPHLNGMPPSLTDLQRAQILSIDPVTWEPTGYKTRILASDNIYEISGKISGQDIKLVQAKTELATDKALREAARLNPGGIEEKVFVDDIPIGIYRIPDGVNLREIQKTAKIDALTTTLGDRIKITSTKELLSNNPQILPDGSIKFTAEQLNTRLPYVLKVSDTVDIPPLTKDNFISRVDSYMRSSGGSNAILRGDKNRVDISGLDEFDIKNDKQDARVLLAGMDYFGDRIPAGTTLYRGVKGGHPIGDYLNDASLQSWTTSPTTAGEYGMVLKYTPKNDITGINTAITGNLDYGESEVILKPKNFMVLSTKNMARSEFDPALMNSKRGILHANNPIRVVEVLRNKSKKSKPKLKLKIKSKKETPLLPRINIKPLNLNLIKIKKSKIIPKKKPEPIFKMPEITLNHKTDKMVDFKIPEINLNLNMDKFVLPIIKKKKK